MNKQNIVNKKKKEENVLQFDPDLLFENLNHFCSDETNGNDENDFDIDIENFYEWPEYVNSHVNLQSTQSTNVVKAANSNNNRNKRFPEVLYELLQETGTNHRQHSIVSWLPHGRAFQVKNRNGFVGNILSKYFKHTQIKSFQRQLQLYEFERIKKGPYKGAYKHFFFRRGNIKLLGNIKR